MYSNAIFSNFKFINFSDSYYSLIMIDHGKRRPKMRDQRTFLLSSLKCVNQSKSDNFWHT